MYFYSYKEFIKIKNNICLLNYYYFKLLKLIKQDNVFITNFSLMCAKQKTH